MDKSKLNLILIVLALIIFVIAVILVVFFTNPAYFTSGLSKGKLIINGKTISIELAKTPEQIINGLSNRSNLKDNQGMLFIFSDKRYRSFWMKDMKFPLDMIWIDDNKIIGIAANVPVPAQGDSNPPVYRSDSEVNYVLEINGGAAEKNNFKVGDEIEILSK
ncbi:MAG: DUF192 domain-containing protein [Candidatus Parcubacteria bacterium]|nr:DUF192 domain-containing protein [Candidatus Parcubacteria bacterium]